MSYPTRFIRGSPLTAPLDRRTRKAVQDAVLPSVAVYTAHEQVFGRMTLGVVNALRFSGFPCIYASTPLGQTQSVKFVEADIHIFVLGHSLSRLLLMTGMPSTGRRVAWVMEPLSKEPEAAVHRIKYEPIAKCLHLSDYAFCMHERICESVKAIRPDLPCSLLPAMLPESVITGVRPDYLRVLDTLCIQSITERRTRLCSWLEAHGLPMLRCEALFHPMLYDALARARLCLNIHPDGYRHFAQCRFMDAWASGTAVLSEPFDDAERYGLVDGQNVVFAEVPDMPAVGRQLLSNPEQLHKIAVDGQTLLRERYTVEANIGALAAVLEGMA